MTNMHEEQKQFWSKETHRKRRHPSHPVVEAYVEPKLAFIFRSLTLPPSPAILDVGAGNGYFSYHLQKRGPTTAVDYSSVMLEENPVADKRLMDARKLTFPDNTYDVVFCHALLHHIDSHDRLQVVREMARVTRKYVVLIEPNRHQPLQVGFALLKKQERGILSFTPAYLLSLLKGAGLHHCTTTTFGLLTPNRMPFARQLLPIFRLFERPLPLGMMTIGVGTK